MPRWPGSRRRSCLRVRRFFCDNPVCPARTFAEQITGLSSAYARRTPVLMGMLAAIALALAGRAGARLARVLGMSVGRDSLLRLVRALPDPPTTPITPTSMGTTYAGRRVAGGLVLVVPSLVVDHVFDGEGSRWRGEASP